MTSPSPKVDPPRDLTKCPICGFRMGMLSRKDLYVVLGCDTCRVSLSLPMTTWDRLTTERQV
jgi:hypothetical protein